MPQTQTFPADEQAAQSVKARLTFIVPQEEKPKFLSQALTGGESEYLFEAEEHEVEIRDLRPAA
ncbi:MAG: hypothetical protein R3360_10015, partial [Alphaproteobacteria bacterium]|nr:hypothetical protein [Alphaproteobacteria bacterium]